MLHDDSGVTVLDDRRTDHFQVFVFEDHLLVVFFLTETERAGSCCCVLSVQVEQHVRRLKGCGNGKSVNSNSVPLPWGFSDNCRWR